MTRATLLKKVLTDFLGGLIQSLGYEKNCRRVLRLPSERPLRELRNKPPRNIARPQYFLPEDSLANKGTKPLKEPQDNGGIAPVILA